MDAYASVGEWPEFSVASSEGWEWIVLNKLPACKACFPKNVNPFSMALNRHLRPKEQQAITLHLDSAPKSTVSSRARRLWLQTGCVVKNSSFTLCFFKEGNQPEIPLLMVFTLRDPDSSFKICCFPVFFSPWPPPWQSTKEGDEGTKVYFITFLLQQLLLLSLLDKLCFRRLLTYWNISILWGERERNFLHEIWKHLHTLNILLGSIDTLIFGNERWSPQWHLTIFKCSKPQKSLIVVSEIVRKTTESLKQ